MQLLDRGKTLEENLEKLDQERQRSEELLYRMMPKAVADELRDGRKAVETCEVLGLRFNSFIFCTLHSIGLNPGVSAVRLV